MQSPSSNTRTESVTGVVERVTYTSVESGYTVARMLVSGFKDLVTVVGNFANIQAGQTLQLRGQWRDHPKYGSQFEVDFYTETKPATLTGIEKYLGSGLIKTVGPVTAKRIVAHFGLETLDIIEQQIDRLIEVPGIGAKKVAIIQKAWAEQKVIKEVMVFLTSHGVSTTYAVKIFKQYGTEARATVTDNPYQLAEDVLGIGFLTADKIARQLGVSPWAISRYKSGILHVLSQASEDGHCFLPQPELVELAVNLLTISEHETEPEVVKNVIEQMGQSGELVIEQAEGAMNLCFKPAFFHTEQHLAKLIKKLLATPIEVDLPRVQNWISKFTMARSLTLSTEQLEAVEKSTLHRVMVLTGGPGTGKTTTTKTITVLWKAMGKKIALAAPTGRAAKRMSEVTGLEAKTIHRLLEFDPSKMGFKRDENNPLPYDAIIVDEASMIDLFLAHSLLKAIPPDGQLLIVGDVDQLASVGPGQVLADLIESGKVPVVRLTEVFRQAAQSAIVRAAHQINQGQYPKLEPVCDAPVSDCLWHNGGQTPEHTVQVIGELITDLVPSLGFDPVTDVQVLCPMIKGAVGTRNLNQVLQQLLNPPSPDKSEINFRGQVFRIGDRVIQLKNDYNREVYNGDLGVVKVINPVDQELIIQFDERSVVYDYADLNEISLAWSTSIHKAQGSEYPVVIMPLSMSHYVMLSRNLVYTGLTRAKKLAIIIGASKVLAIAVGSQNIRERYTRLKERLTRSSKN